MPTFLGNNILKRVLGLSEVSWKWWGASIKKGGNEYGSHFNGHVNLATAIMQKRRSLTASASSIMTSTVLVPLRKSRSDQNSAAIRSKPCIMLCVRGVVMGLGTTPFRNLYSCPDFLAPAFSSVQKCAVLSRLSIRDLIFWIIIENLERKRLVSFNIKHCFSNFLQLPKCSRLIFSASFIRNSWQNGRCDSQIIFS